MPLEERVPGKIDNSAGPSGMSPFLDLGREGSLTFKEGKPTRVLLY